MHFLITAGGTREYIDPVRFISNASSGKMGYALARGAIGNGHEVTLITGPTNLRPPRGASVIEVVTSGEMFQAVKDHFDGCDCLVMAAAVSDYKPSRQSGSKIKTSGENLTIVLRPTTDILKWAGSHKGRRLVIGFALEDRDVLVRAEKKLKAKGLDMIVANEPSAIGAESSSVWVKTRDGEWQSFEQKSKDTIAGQIIRMAESQFKEISGQD